MLCCLAPGLARTPRRLVAARSVTWREQQACGAGEPDSERCDMPGVLAVCGDVIVSHELDDDLAVFDREATSFAAAVGSALADLERSLPAARVLRVEAVPVAGELSVAAVS